MNLENDLDNSPQQDLWAELADTMAGVAETSGSEMDAGVTFKNRTPVIRRIGLGEKLVAKVLTGFVPVLLLLGVAITLSLREWEPLGLGLGLLLAVPLAWLIAPLFQASRANLWTFVGCGVLAAGAMELTTVIPEAATEYLTAGHDLGRWQLIASLQIHLESFLTWSHWATYAALGVLALAVVGTVGRRNPWIDVPTPGRARAIAAWAVVLSPVLLVLWCGSVFFLEQRETAQWIREYRDRRTPLPWSYRNDTPWASVYRNLPDPPIQSMPMSPGLSARPSPQIQALEKVALTTWSSPDHAILTRGDSHQVQSILVYLLQNHTSLADPLKTAYAYLEFAFEYRPQSIDQESTLVFSDVLLPRFAGKLTPEQLPLWMARIEGLLSQCNQVKEDINIDIADQFQEILRDLTRPSSGVFIDGAPRPLRAFGFELPYSPLSLTYYVEAERVLRPWLDVQERLDTEQLNHLFSEFPSEDHVDGYRDWFTAKHLYRQAIYRQYAPKLKPYLETAQLILALRQSKATTGYWPETLEAVSSDLSFPLKNEAWSYQVEGKTAQLKALFPQSKDHQKLEWVLQ